MKLSILKDKEKYFKQEYTNEDELTTLFSKHYKKIISENSFWIPIERQVKAKKFKNFKHSISDGFLLVWDNPTTPSMFITEIELANHDINKHILPQLGNFISFIQSANKEELTDVRDFLYNEIEKNKAIFEKLKKETKKEVHKLFDNSMEDLQILLVIDRMIPELSIGLSQIEKAIKVKIRKIEVSKFLDDKKKEVILFSDSEEEEEKLSRREPTEPTEYTIEYHVENKPEKIVKIVNSFINYTKGKGLKISPMKHYIGFFKNKSMIFSCVVRKNTVIFYSKSKIDEIKRLPESLPLRDVRRIGHYTNHLPTEIILTEEVQIQDLVEYFDKVYQKY